MSDAAFHDFHTADNTLEVRHLRTRFFTREGELPAVEDVSLTLARFSKTAAESFGNAESKFCSPRSVWPRWVKKRTDFSFTRRLRSPIKPAAFIL